MTDRVGFQNSVASRDQRFSGCEFVLVDQPSKDWSTTDPAQNRLGDRRFRARRAEPEGAMRPLSVVVRGVLGQHPAEVPLPEDQHPVGQLGADGQHEAFGEAVRPRTPRRDLDHLDPRIRQDRVERVGSMSTAPARRRTAASTSEATSPTARSGVSVMRPACPPLCSTTASWGPQIQPATSYPEPSGAGSGAVSHPRAVSRSAACCSCGSGGASLAASLPRTWTCPCSVSHVAAHCW